MGVLVTSKIYTERVKHWHLLALISGRSWGKHLVKIWRRERERKKVYSEKREGRRRRVRGREGEGKKGGRKIEGRRREGGEGQEEEGKRRRRRGGVREE